MNPFTQPSNRNPKLSQTWQVYKPDLSKFTGDYIGLAEGNPYANVQYRKSWMQSLLGNLGFRTNFDAYMESMSQQAREYENAVLQKQYDESYNSPLQQAMRERDAGLNPDLAGNIDSGSASPIQDDGNPPIAPQADELSTITTFASSVINGLQSAFSLASGVVDLSGRMLDNRSKRLGQITQEDRLMFDALLNVLPSDSDSPLDYNQLYSQFKRTYGSRIKKRYFPDFVNRALAFQNGLSFSDEAYGKREARAGKRKGFYIKTSGSDYSEENEVMREVSGFLSDMFLALDKSNVSTSLSENDARQAKSANDVYYEQSVRPEEISNKLEYEQNLDPSKLAKNEMVSSDLETGLLRNEKDNSDYQKTLRSSYQKLFKKLEEMEDDGNWFAPIAKMFISAYLLGNLPGINISRSSSPKGSRWSASVK